MTTCKDCVHVDMCEKYEEISSLIKGGKCSLFKDRSRFVKLPIKPGEKIYYFDTAGRIYKSTVNRLVYTATGFLIDSDVMFNSNLIGERFFLTREAAEQALKEHEIND